MSEQAHPPVQVDPNFTRIFHGIRFALGIFLLSVCYLNLRATMNIGRFATMYRDMLGTKPLPPLTTFVLSNSTWLFLLSILLPSVILVTMASPKVARSFYIFGIVGLTAMVQLIITSQGLMAPAAQIISALSGVPASPAQP
jgi:hypothetical protein